MTITAAPKSTSVGRDLVFGVPLMAAGIGCLMLLRLSDARGPVSFPPDDSLYSVQNWLQAAAIVIAGLLIAVPKVSRSVKCAAGGVAPVSSGLLLGTAIWAMKHWASHRGFIGLDFQRVDKMEQLTALVAAASLVAAATALSWLVSSSAISTSAATFARKASVVAGAITIVALPLMIGIGSGYADRMDVTSLGTFALLFSLPWGLAFILGAFLVRPAALGAITTTAVSTAWWVVAALRTSEPVLSVGFGLVLLASGWLITLTWRDRTRLGR